MPNSHAIWDPNQHKHDPVGDLTLALRHLRLGDTLRMPDGTTVKSIAVPRGSNSQRRFAVLPPLAESTPQQRHRVLQQAKGSIAKAEDTAKRILKVEEN